jgi:hypothetical protein
MAIDAEVQMADSRPEERVIDVSIVVVCGRPIDKEATRAFSESLEA